MGFTSWMFADTNNEERLKCCGQAYVPCPDGTIIHERFYDGYCHFGCYDLFELVAEWNRTFLSVDNVACPRREQWSDTDDGEKWFLRAMERYEVHCQMVSDFASGKSEDYLLNAYGCDWKRDIGIIISHADENNAKLPFPIKVCKNKPDSYASLPASKRDPFQGCD